MDQVYPRLYVGDIQSALNESLIENNSIKRILATYNGSLPNFMVRQFNL